MSVEMRAENEVNVLWRNTCSGRLLKKRIVVAVVPMREILAHLIVANATIDKDRVATGLHEIALDRHNELPSHRRQRFRYEAMKMGPDGFIRAIGKPLHRRFQRVRHLQNPSYPDTSKFPDIL